MMENKTYLSWMGVRDSEIVEEMLRDPDSEQWTKCRDFVEMLVHNRAKNISPDSWDDIIQEAMIKIDKSLSTFQYRCSLKSWLFRIVSSCIIDDYRKIIRNMQYITFPTDSYDSHEGRELNDIHGIQLSRTIEEYLMIREEAYRAIAALQKYISSHKKAERNRQILNMVLYESCSLEEAAKAAGCSTAVAGYVVRSAQHYVREKLRH